MQVAACKSRWHRARAVRAGRRDRLVGRGAGAKDRIAGLHGARDRPDQGVRDSVQQGLSGHRAQVGARFDRRHHREGSRRKGESAGRLGRRHLRVEHGGVRQRRHAAAVRAQGTRQDLPRSIAIRRIRRAGSAWTSTAPRICFNTVEAQKQNLPKPESWKDLTKPVYKGKIVMPNPASSGTGFLDVVGLAADVGRAGRLEVHGRAARERRASTRTRARSRAARPGAGEFPIGISFEYRAVTTKKSGAPIDIVFPTEGLGWDLEASRHHEDDQEGRGGAQADGLACDAGRDGAVRRRTSRSSRCRECAKPLEFVPADYEKRLIKNDFAWSAKNRDKILAEWTKRYDGKSLPK